MKTSLRWTPASRFSKSERESRGVKREGYLQSCPQNESIKQEFGGLKSFFTETQTRTILA